MPSPWVLLNDIVDIMDEKEAVGGEGYGLIGCWAGSLEAEEAPFGGVSKKVAEAEAESLRLSKLPDRSPRDPHQAEAMKLVAHLADPPKVTSLALILSGERLLEKLKTSYLSSVDRDLFLMYVGPRRPYWHSSGYYMIYDAAKNSLTVIDEMPLARELTTSGDCRAVILRCHGEDKGACIVAELMVIHGDPPAFTLWLWRSDRRSGWVQVPPRIPSEVQPFKFLVDKAFTFRGSYFCWADLLRGILIWNTSSGNYDFSFIPLPEGCSSDVPIHDRGCPVDYRNIGCCKRSIKFVHIDGFPNGALSIWILAKLDPVEWTMVTRLSFKDLWEDDSYQSSLMPRWVPMFPTLIPDDDDIVYFIINKFCSRYIDMDMDIGNKEHIFGVNTRSRKVVCHNGACLRTGLGGGMLVPCLFPQLPQLSGKR